METITRKSLMPRAARLLLAIVLSMSMPAASWAAEFVTDVRLIGGETYAEVQAKINEYRLDGWKLVDYDLNKGCGKNSDYIYVKVLEQGSGTESPLFTDTARVAFQGRLIPSETYPKGYMFTYTYLGDFNWSTIGTSDGVSWKDGFSTAVQNMHIGDRWLVYIPYDLMYGAGSDTGYPAYSNMIFDIALVDFWHPGEYRPAFKSRQK